MLFSVITSYFEIRNYFGMGLFWKLSWPFWLKTVVGFIILDLWLYIIHKANHRIPFLWEFHKAHHTDTQIDASTASRFHPGQVFFSIFLDLPFMALIGFQPIQLLYFIITFRIIEIFQHSNIVFPEIINKIAEKIIVTPTFHRFHHSQEVQQTNSNYGVFFSFWDRIFHSKCSANSEKEIKFGLKDYSDAKWQTLFGILRTPFSTKLSITRFKFQARKNGIESSW